MKAQHRHELETNTLAKGLNSWGEKLRPYSSLMLMGIAAVVGLYAVLSMWNDHTASREDQAWFEYEKALLAGDPDYQGVRRAAASDDLAGSRMQEWAYVAWADRQLRRASEEYLVNRESSKGRLTEAARAYETYANDALDSEVRNRARLGLARVRELQNRLKDARAEYARVEGALQQVAEARLKELEDKGEDADATAEWLATAELPTPAAPTGPGSPGVRPGFGAEPPAADGATSPLDPARTMSEILGGSDDDAGRYGGETADATATDAPAAEDAATEEPATDVAAEPATEEAGDAAAKGAGAEPATTDDAAPATPPATPPAGQ